jgi:hypothetical protein
MLSKVKQINFRQKAFLYGINKISVTWELITKQAVLLLYGDTKFRHKGYGLKLGPYAIVLVTEFWNVSSKAIHKRVSITVF